MKMLLLFTHRLTFFLLLYVVHKVYGPVLGYFYGAFVSLLKLEYASVHIYCNGE